MGREVREGGRRGGGKEGRRGEGEGRVEAREREEREGVYLFSN